MNKTRLQTALIAGIVLTTVAWAQAEENEEGFVKIFDGKTLNGWDGRPEFWRVEDNCITGQTTKENPTSGNTFIIWRGGKTGDFELKLEYRIVGGNSGIQYRSFEVPDKKWVIGGYQADFEAGKTFSGILYGEKFRGILARRGDKTVIGDNGKPKVVGSVGESAAIQAKIKHEDWNEYHIIAKDYKFIHKINGVQTIECVDEDSKTRRAEGLLALQLHAGPPMLVQFRNIRIKQAKTAKKAPAAEKSSSKKKIVFMAGVRSHGYGSHEHYAGCMLLARSLQATMPDYDVVVLKDGWPKDPKAFHGADAVVMYCDGGGGHPVNRNLEQIDKLAKAGVGIACLHYGVEVPKGPSGQKFLDWIGGYFETNWSVNPHWVAKFDTFPEHPVTRGVKPFEADDEWYYHMRFRPNMKGVTPILSDLPPQATLNRRDGAHSGNPAVRAAIARKEPQHVAWVCTREDGGRGFGFTGGHNHWNWGNENLRKVVLNALVWVAQGDVPENGVTDKPLTIDELQKNQDYRPPNNFNPENVIRKFKLDSARPAAKTTSSTTDSAATKVSATKVSVTNVSVTTKSGAQDKAGKSKAAKPRFASKVVTSRTPGHSVPIDVDIRDAKQLYLVVTDGGNGYGCDWANWAEPRLVGPQGEIKLTDLKWKHAQADWGRVNKNRNAGGGPLRIAGKPVEYGIGAHANSLIVFDVPKGCTQFRARGGLDNGGTDQAAGGNSSVNFLVFTAKPPTSLFSRNSGGGGGAGRDPAEAVAALDVGDGLEASLVASEPRLLSLTNLDIDSRGRIWVCEVVNYRGHRNKRQEGDRILILEDTDGDGKADTSKVFYQGRDVDSAMGICVLGNKVIVSCSPNVLVFTDENGDDKPDKKELLFTKTGQPQHDHSAHSFLFGPDGKLYWNFGNTGRAVHDKDGKPVVDLAGNKVVDNGKPYFGGMAFRCNLDGSEFEVLGHNFRNNYEVSVDSFGTLWQSDNDDDGNRGVRINYVMEFGNYGYRDEMTGAGWQAKRTNMHPEVPKRHWHLNDPGVVPNLLQTGAGSPCGITVYEGRLLPKRFWDQVIHCDPGPNVVRAYPVTNDGAGYSAEIDNVLHGARDNWFRPADACVAPDGSLFITDWYDPGVGGHGMRDLERGRLFRVAPPGAKYSIPKFDFTTADGAAQALLNPANSVRYLAWTALQEMGPKAEASLAKIYQDSDNPRHRARALWALGKLDGLGEKYVKAALADDNPNIRIVGIRLARQLKMDVLPIVKQVVRDPSAHVRRDAAIALRNNKTPQAAELWAELASQHDGKDRWYLEALGISADGQWDEFLAAWQKRVGKDWATPAGRDVVWRSRAKATPGLLVQIIKDKSTPTKDHPHYMRAFDFLKGPEKDAALQTILLEL